jgi:hypothetical protein
MTARARRRPTLAAAGVVVLAVVLGACTGEPSVTDPVPVASASSPVASASPTPSQAATAPAWDATMDQVTVDGALAVGKYFLELFTYVSATGDTTEWDRLSDPACGYCADVSEHAPANVSDALGFVSTVEPSGAREVEVGAYYSADYTVTDTYEDGVSSTYRANVAVLWDGSAWHVAGVQIDDATANG